MLVCLIGMRQNYMICFLQLLHGFFFFWKKLNLRPIPVLSLLFLPKTRLALLRNPVIVWKSIMTSYILVFEWPNNTSMRLWTNYLFLPILSSFYCSFHWSVDLLYYFVANPKVKATYCIWKLYVSVSFLLDSNFNSLLSTEGHSLC